MFVTATMLGVIVVSAAGTCVWVRARGRTADDFHRFRCSGCGQKLRYQAVKAGRMAMCPRCGRRWTLPANAPMHAPALEACDGYRLGVGQRITIHRSKARAASAR